MSKPKRIVFYVITFAVTVALVILTNLIAADLGLYRVVRP